MQISQRAQRMAESATMAVTGRAAQLRREGVDVVSFGAGEPDFDTPEHVKKAAIDALEGGQTGYAAPASGIVPLKTAIVHALARDAGLQYGPDQLIVTCGGKEALFLAFAAILDPGDEVIVPAPYWVSFPEQVTLCDGVPVIVEGNPQNDYKLTPDQVAAAVTDRTRAFVFNSPSNPGGFVYSPAEAAAIAKVLAGTGVIVLADEIYDQLVFGGASFANFASLSEDAYARTITFNASSKTYAMTGWRLGFAAGPAEIIGAMSKIQTQTTSGACNFTQFGYAAALAGDQGIVAERREEFARRGRYCFERLNAMPGVVCPRPQGAFYVLPDISANFERLGVAGSVEFSQKLLEEGRVAVVPGEAFGMDATVRLSFATDMETIARGLDRIAAFLA